MRENELKSSRLLGLLLAGVAVLVLVAIGFAALPGNLQWALGGVVVGLVGWGWRRASRMACLRIDSDGQLQAQDDANDWCEVEVLRQLCRNRPDRAALSPGRPGFA